MGLQSDTRENRHKVHVPRFMRSLRVKMAVGVALPVLLLAQLIPLAHAWRERALIEEQLRFVQTQLGSTLVGSLEYAMLANDQSLLNSILARVTWDGSLKQVQVVGLDGVVHADSRQGADSNIGKTVEPGCVACHQQAQVPAATALSVEPSVMRIAAPIPSKPECLGCHPGADAHLGVLIADVSVAVLNAHLEDDLRTDLLLAGGLSLTLAVAVYVLLHWLIVRRLEKMESTVLKYASGDFAQRMPTGTDEIGELGQAFNDMAEQVEHYTREQKQRVRVRQRAIVEERERIARELHDGLAQLLGYVNTKAMAARLMLKRNQLEQADKNLLQLEDAARGLYLDVREAILGLKMAGRSGTLMGALNDYVLQFSRLCDLPVKLTISPEVARRSLQAETELQLLRIVQEALTNIRKHAAATQAEITLQTVNHHLELSICDNGQGFELEQVRPSGASQFGLTSMRERAEGIGAELDLQTQPGVGTRLMIRLPLTE